MDHDILHMSVEKMMTLLAEISIYFMAPIIIIGLAVAVFQAATQINEQSLSLVPKFAALFLIIMTFGSVLMNKICDFLIELYSAIPTLV
ncbi:flagellar biosynthetic protein FliQ [Vibrio sp. D431a]|uniref:flagellar biosynthetic protein FliQ n=1 Tax=Vibrio sp. D431a TaxID=2837388 RepID=UPI0025560D72|nr:flagellar biosynthetic protein FliQ [Vibrio sp. D431a]MDK9793902.1 flagellar biosynthetic protein FliQ [Vibrio sp. D431a]